MKCIRNSAAKAISYLYLLALETNAQVFIILLKYKNSNSEKKFDCQHEIVFLPNFSSFNAFLSHGAEIGKKKYYLST